MAGRYERVRRESDVVPRRQRINRVDQVNAQDEDDSQQQQRGLGHTVPNSPPPSFRSRASSRTRQNQVDPDLADAFDSDDDSDDETDDRQRLVRQAATPTTTASGSTSPTPAPYTPPSTGSAASSAATRGRVVGGGVGTDGVFANMSARPEREAAAEKEEMPPVCIARSFTVLNTANILDRHTSKPQRTLHHPTGKRRFWPPASVVSTKYTWTACRSAPSSPSSGTA